MDSNLKSSNLKPNSTIDDVTDFVCKNFTAQSNTIEKLSEGHSSQVFSFLGLDKIKHVIRIGKNLKDFKKDQFMYALLCSGYLPVPEVVAVGEFMDGPDYYCVSRFIAGLPSDKLSDDDMGASLSGQWDCFAKLFKFDVSKSTGWGYIDPNTGNGIYGSWQESLDSEVNKIDKKFLSQCIVTLGLDSSATDRLYRNYHENSYLSPPIRRLIHEDLGFDNVLVNKGEVVAIIDWASASYGDWVSDFARFDFWWPERYGNIKEFGEKYELDMSDLDRRVALSWAYIALTTIDFAFKNESLFTQDWLKENLRRFV